MASYAVSLLRHQTRAIRRHWRVRGKEKAAHGGWEGLFLGSNRRFDGQENRRFEFNLSQAKRYIKVASYPFLARQALLKAKEKVGHGGWEGLFGRQKHGSEGGKNPCFYFSQLQAQRYIKVASYPSLARQALLKAKEKVGHGGWEGLFGGANLWSRDGKNHRFGFSKIQAKRYIKVASYPALARQALLKAKEKVGHGGFGALFRGTNVESEGAKNSTFRAIGDQADMQAKLVCRGLLVTNNSGGNLIPTRFLLLP